MCDIFHWCFFILVRWKILESENDVSKWITREDTYSEYHIYETKPFWVERWKRWGGTPLFSVDSNLLETLRPDLKLKGGLNKEGRKELILVR